MTGADQDDADLPTHGAIGVTPVEKQILPPALPSPVGNLPSTSPESLPEIIHRAGANAVFAAQEFFFGTLRNEHTRRAYRQAVKRFLAWIEKHGGGSWLG